MRVYVAMWKYPDEEMEISVHNSESGAMQSLTEEVQSFMDDDSFSFDPEEYDDLLADEMLGYDNVDDGTLWVELKIMEVMA